MSEGASVRLQQDNVRRSWDTYTCDFHGRVSTSCPASCCASPHLNAPGPFPVVLNASDLDNLLLWSSYGKGVNVWKQLIGATDRQIHFLIWWYIYIYTSLVSYIYCICSCCRRGPGLHLNPLPLPCCSSLWSSAASVICVWTRTTIVCMQMFGNSTQIPQEQCTI